MPADDALFEKALARQMRNRTPSDAPTANGESAPGDAGAEQRNLGGDACPDAEILAAYHERLLASDEMNLWKEHIFSCARCQEILSQLEATEDVFVGAREGDYAGVAHGHELAPMVSALSASASPAKAVGQVAAPVVMRRRATRYWIAPAGAIAAGLFVWLGMHYQSQNISRKKEAEIAENRPAVPPNGTAEPYSVANADNKAAAPSSIDKLDSGAERELQALTKKSLSAKAPAPAPEVTNARGASAGTLGGVAANEPTAKQADKPASNADAGGQQAVPKAVTQTVEVTSAAAPVAQDQMSSGANVAPLPTERGQELQAMQAPAAPRPAAAPRTSQVQNNRAQNAQTQNGQTQNTQTQNAQTQDKDAQSSNAQAAGALIGAQSEEITVSNSRDVLEKAKTENPQMIPAPGGNIVWRVGKSGRIEQSANAGAMWTRQKSGVKVMLDSGSAPSAAVCWVAGRAGTILLTVDGGVHWTKIDSPIAGDIGGIIAADALHATIWDTDRKNNFMTTDGGATWTRVANP
jgi:hypothetical protein